jgi:hypothetical protein
MQWAIVSPVDIKCMSMNKNKIIHITTLFYNLHSFKTMKERGTLC